MSARVLSILERRRPRAVVTAIGFRPADMRFAVGCRCGYSTVLRSRTDAREAKRRHDAAHRAAEHAHPAGTARAGGAS